MDLDDDGFDDGFDSHALMLGTGYALYRHGQDRQTMGIIDAINALRDSALQDDDLDDIEVDVSPAANALEYTTANLPQDWEDFIGQDPLKRDLMVRVASAKVRDVRLPHILLASGYPGVGKTTMARLLSQVMGAGIVEIVPPFKIDALVAVARQLQDKDILFVDEVHKLADNGGRGAEILLKVLEDGVAPLPSGEMVILPDITIIGATTDPDKLPETVVDRFKIKPYFQAYNETELARIAVKHAWAIFAEQHFDKYVMYPAIAYACRGTPRIVEEMVEAVRDLGVAHGTQPTPEELLEFIQVEPDGLTRTHIHYLTAMRQYFRRETKDGEIEYIIGEAAIQQILRETKQGIGRVERFLVERGLIDRTPRGRRLTALGIARAEEFIAAGKGVSHV